MLDAEPLTVADGEFRLFAPDDEPDVQHMTYRLPLAADDGREWFLTGIKVIDRGRLRDLWHDTTTLYVDIHEGTDDSGPVVYRGVLRISVGDFTRQLRTMTRRARAVRVAAAPAPRPLRRDVRRQPVGPLRRDLRRTSRRSTPTRRRG